MTASAGRGAHRVLIIVENLPVPFDRRVWQEANTLHDAGYQVEIICPTGKGHTLREENIEGIRVHRYHLPFEARSSLGYLIEYPVALLLQFWLTLKIFLTRGFDVIHACNPPDNIFLIGLFFRPYRVKFLFDHHDINPELYEAKFGRKDLFYKIMLLWERWTFKAAHLSIATNESYKKIAITRGGMEPDKVFVVRSGPDLKRLRQMPADVQQKHGRSFLVGYVGVMGQQEGIDLLLQAVAHIVLELKRGDIHFTLVGSGPELDTLIASANNMGVGDYITFTGRVSDEVLLAVLNSADICVNPDRANAMNDKSTMNKIMEYMALGKPIVQFDLTEGRFSAGQASVYARQNDPVDFAEKILSLLADPNVRQEMGDFGRARVVEELAWEYEAPKLLAAYDAILGKGSS